MTKIIAHRGASIERPENTLCAFRRAIELGAEGFELDVHMLKGGELIVTHDSKLGRCADSNENLYDLTANQVRQIDVGSWFSSDYAGEKFPFLEEILSLMENNELYLNAEIKIDTPFITQIEDRVVDLLKSYHMENRCIISSFNHYILKNIKNNSPNIKVGALYGEPFKYDSVEYAANNKFDAVHPYYAFIDEDFVNRCRNKGIEVNVWTVNKADDIKKMLDFKVDSIITDDVKLGVDVKRTKREE